MSSCISCCFCFVNANGIKTLLANGFNTVFSNGPKCLLKNPPDCHILCNWVLDNFILTEELFAKTLWGLKTCVLFNNKLCGELFSSLESPTTFEDILKSYFSTILYFKLNLLSCD